MSAQRYVDYSSCRLSKLADCRLLHISQILGVLQAELAKGRHTRPVEGYDSLVSSSGSSKCTTGSPIFSKVYEAHFACPATACDLLHVLRFRSSIGRRCITGSTSTDSETERQRQSTKFYRYRSWTPSSSWEVRQSIFQAS